METTSSYSFQVDSDIVKETYCNLDNYLIEYSFERSKEYCIIYFSGNNLYHPNTEVAFWERLVAKNHFEWYNTRINRGYKHIFVRDIQKQFYLAGINSSINSSQKLLSFLKLETSGYRIITIGCSAGGFAAVVYGQLLNAEMIYSFNGGFEIGSKLSTSEEKINPIIFRNKENKEFEYWFDTRNFITKASTIFYFQSIKSKWDLNQYNHVKDMSINRIQFLHANHGIPFLRTNLPYVLNQSQSALLQLTGKAIHPIAFSIKSVGMYQTLFALASVVRFEINKLFKRALLKLITYS